MPNKTFSSSARRKHSIQMGTYRKELFSTIVESGLISKEMYIKAWTVVVHIMHGR